VQALCDQTVLLRPSPKISCATMTKEISFHYFNTNPEIIQLAVIL